VPFSACGQKLSGRTTVRACLASAVAALIMTTSANADVKDVVADRFSSNVENMIVNLPPRPGTWPPAPAPRPAATRAGLNEHHSPRIQKDQSVRTKLKIRNQQTKEAQKSGTMIAHHMAVHTGCRPRLRIIRLLSSCKRVRAHSKTMDMFRSERDWLQFSPTAQFLLTAL
jgi:hypothetical protein